MPEASPDVQSLPDSLELADGLRAPLVILGHMLRRASAELALTMPQSAVLGQLSQVSAMRMTELATIEGVKPSTMTDLLNRMENKMWISRVPHDNDRRVTMWSITPTGRARLRDVIEQRNELLQELISKLPISERKAIERAIPALRQLAGIDDTVMDTLRASRRA